MPQDAPRLYEILVVEDDLGTCYLMEKALRGTTVKHHVSSVHDGDAAMELLQRGGRICRGSPSGPDLSRPAHSEGEWLGTAPGNQSHPVLRRIPVIVLTSSSDQKHVNSVYDLYANCYLQKRSDWSELCRQIRSIEEFWFGMVLWPTTVEYAAGR